MVFLYIETDKIVMRENYWWENKLKVCHWRKVVMVWLSRPTQDNGVFV